MITVRNTSDGQISERIKLSINISERQPIIGKLNSSIKGVETEDATATERDIRDGEIAYVKGKQVIGKLGETRIIKVIATDMDYAVGGLYGPVGIAEFDEDDIIMLKDGKIRMTMPLEELKIWLGIESEQILSGNTILGVEGTATSDATATENSLMEGEVAYVNGEKITGIIKEYDGSYSGSGIIV